MSEIQHVIAGGRTWSSGPGFAFKAKKAHAVAGIAVGDMVEVTAIMMHAQLDSRAIVTVRHDGVDHDLEVVVQRHPRTRAAYAYLPF